MPETTGQAAGIRDDRTVVALPSLGADMDVGTVIEWCVAVGDRVERGDVVAIVATEKSDIDVETWDSGVVVELLAPLDTELEVGHPLIALSETNQPGANDMALPSESPSDPLTATPSLESVAEEPAAAPRSHLDPPNAVEVATTATDGRIKASPFARRLATERGIDLHELTGSGPDGSVIAADVSDHTRPSPSAGAATADPRRAEPTSTSPPFPLSPADRMRRVIADRMSRANRDIPHYHLELDIDMTPALDWLTIRNEQRPIAERVVPAALLACACARAAQRVPQLNGTWADDRFVPSVDVDLGVVVSLRTGGLVVPTVPAAATTSPEVMMTTLRSMVTDARKGKLRSRWTTDASITITNLGEHGADRVAGVVFPPQVALAGFGRIAERPWVVDGRLAVRSVVTATLSADHRASDGADGSRFLAEVARLLADPSQLGA